jgi:hypothetical protein
MIITPSTSACNLQFVGLQAKGLRLNDFFSSNDSATKESG